VTEQVLGFAFDDAGVRIVVMHKLRPAPIAGKICVPGGKNELSDLDLFHTMAREFSEEAGVNSSPEEWIYACDIVGKHGLPIALFFAYNDKFMTAKTMTDEAVEIMTVDDFLLAPNVVEDMAECIDYIRDPLIKKTHYSDLRL
jgi:8-oxo-dGTP pyrophosphatase MutT (NUDIX family)